MKMLEVFLKEGEEEDKSKYIRDAPRQFPFASRPKGTRDRSDLIGRYGLTTGRVVIRPFRPVLLSTSVAQ